MNSDLANTLGNLVNRTISMSNKYCGGVVTKTGAAEEVDDDLKAVVTVTKAKVAAKMEELRVADAMTEIFGDRKSTRLNSSHLKLSRMPSSA